MENKNKYLWILTLVGLTLGSTFNNYGQNEDEVALNKTVKISGSAVIEAANNLGMKYAAKTTFTPSLIDKNKTGKELVDNLVFDAMVKLGFEKDFSLQEDKAKGVMEFEADRETFKIGKLYFEAGNWTAGIKENNFCNISTLSRVKVLQLSWKKKLTPNFTLAFGIEESKKFQVYKEGDSAKIASSDITPRRDVPAASGRLEYAFEEDFGCLELSGLVRPMGFHKKSTAKTEYQVGYGVNLSGRFDFVPKVDKLTINFIFGEGVGSYISDLARLSKVEESNVYLKGVNNEVKPIIALGGYISFEHFFTPAVCATISSGITRILSDEDKDTRRNAYLMGIYVTPSLMYWLTEQTGFGVEYSLGNRTDMNNDNMQAQHLNILAQFKF